MSHASSGGGRLHATSTRKQLGDGEAKQRRVAYGSDVIKDELRKGTGGPQGAGPEQVGDSSEDDDEEMAAVGRRDSITRYVLGGSHPVASSCVYVGVLYRRMIHLCLYILGVLDSSAPYHLKPSGRHLDKTHDRKLKLAWSCLPAPIVNCRRLHLCLCTCSLRYTLLCCV